MLWDAETKGKNIHTAKILDVTMQMHWDDEKKIMMLDIIIE